MSAIASQGRRMRWTWLLLFCVVVIFFCYSRVGSAEEDRINVNEAGSVEQEEVILDVKWQDNLVTLDTRNADVHDVMRDLSKASGVEIKIFEGVEGEINLSLERICY